MVYEVWATLLDVFHVFFESRPELSVRLRGLPVNVTVNYLFVPEVKNESKIHSNHQLCNICVLPAGVSLLITRMDWFDEALSVPPCIRYFVPHSFVQIVNWVIIGRNPLTNEPLNGIELLDSIFPGSPAFFRGLFPTALAEQISDRKAQRLSVETVPFSLCLRESKVVFYAMNLNVFESYHAAILLSWAMKSTKVLRSQSLALLSFAPELVSKGGIDGNHRTSVFDVVCRICQGLNINPMQSVLLHCSESFVCELHDKSGAVRGDIVVSCGGAVVERIERSLLKNIAEIVALIASEGHVISSRSRIQSGSGDVERKPHVGNCDIVDGATGKGSSFNVH